MLPQSPLSPSAGRRARSLLAVLVALALALLAAAPAHASVSSFLGSFDNGGFSAFNDGVNTTNATLGVVSDRAYDGSESAFASYPGGGVNAYARVLEDVSWGAGDDVWYGAAYYLPTGFKAAMQQEVALQRWDNWSTYGSSADEGGIVIWNSDKLARLKVGRYDAATETLLTSGFAVPEGRWFWLEVHQRFSATSGQALNEVYLDGTLVGHSTTANYDRPIEKLRTGLVAQGGIAQTNPLSLWFDRVSIGSQQAGPIGGTTSTSPTPTPTPAPAPAPVAPTVTIASPADGTTFGDWLGMSASVTADTTIASVDFLVDGTVVASRTGSPWSYTYDARGLSSGWHTVTIRATDADGLVGQASVQVKHYVKTHGNTRLAKAADTRIHMSVKVRHRHSGKKRHRKHHRRHAHATRRTHRHAHHAHRRHRHRTA